MNRVEFEREEQAYLRGKSMILYHVVRIISINKKYVQIVNSGRKQNLKVGYLVCDASGNVRGRNGHNGHGEQ